MKFTAGALLGAYLCLALAYHLLAQSTDPAAAEEFISQLPNLDLAPELAPDPERLQEVRLATYAIQEPENYHALLMRLDPQRRAREEAAALAILFPVEFHRAHALPPEAIQAEINAARTILAPEPPQAAATGPF